MSAPALCAMLDAQPDLWSNDDTGATDDARTPDARAAIALVPPRKPSLSDRMARVAFIADTIERIVDEGEMDDATRDALSADLIAELAGTREKVDAVSATLGMFESLAAASHREMERLKARCERYQKQQARLESYVLALLTASGLDRIEGETSTLAKRLNPAAVQIEEGAQVGHEFLFYPEPPAPRPDKTAIKKALKAGRMIPGCALAQTARLVRS
jgi:hypothetical protein